MIEITRLTKHYGTKVALKDLTLNVPRGELFCFIGPNGAGKTTTIKILTGLLKPSHGTAIIGGHSIQADALEAKKLMGYIPDMPFLYERLTAAEFFQFTADLYNVARPTVVEQRESLFSFFGLEECTNMLVKDLSHGLRQRLIYASTFLHKPDVLFVDEPFIGLDPYSIRLIKDLLVRSAREGMTIFLTTHILALAEDIADRIGIIADGELAALGSLGDLLQQHGTHTLEDAFLKLTAPADHAGVTHYPM